MSDRNDRYTWMPDDGHGPWISAPRNGGDVGDLSDIVEELNMLLRERDELKAKLIATAHAHTHTHTHLKHQTTMNEPAVPPKPKDSPEEQTSVGRVARFVRHLLLWVARYHPKNQTAENIEYPQLWYCWPRWMKRQWGPFGGPKQKGVHRLLTGTCGMLTGHEWSKTEIGYGGCGVDRWCRWCDKMVTMPLCESPLPKELKDISKQIKKT